VPTLESNIPVGIYANCGVIYGTLETVVLIPAVGVGPVEPTMTAWLATHRPKNRGPILRF